MNDLDYIRKALSNGVISQNKLAEHSGVSQRTISNIHRGIGSPSYANVVAIRTALDRITATKPAPKRRRNGSSSVQAVAS
jgi:predicted transcriptional regulator